jgi:ribosomal protein S12 methylthiotransferase
VSDIKSVNFITLGCSKNLVDSEKIMGQLDPARFDISHDGSGSADVVIINTCGFIGDAKQESIDMILQYAAARTKGQMEQLIVIGCLSQRYRSELTKEIPEVDAWYGVDEAASLFAHLNEHYNEKSAVRRLTTPSHYAYLKISEGCDRTCAFCAIPQIRGKHRSVPVADLVQEARELAAGGVKELLLVAQDLSSYGYDLSGTSLLAVLLEALSAVEGIRWIRMHYAYPVNFPADVLQIMKDNPRVCRYIDIPLQHINDSILRSMRRGHNRATTLRLIGDMREQVPGIALRTTLLVGYPGETNKDFKELMEFVREVRFDRLGVFAYSPEEGTPAWSLEDTVSEKLKAKRVETIMELQQHISLEINLSRLGQQLMVVVDREEDDYYIGRTEFDSPEVDNEVLIKKSGQLQPGEFIMVQITDAGAYELFGEVVS